MALGTGAALPTAQPLLKTEYEQALRNYLKRNCPIWSSISREGWSTLKTAFKTHIFAFQKTQGGQFRGVGQNDENDLDGCEDGPTFGNSTITYNHFYAPTRVKEEVFHEATEGAMGNAFLVTLEDLQKGCLLEFERMMLSTTGNAVLFQLDDAGTDNGDGTWTFSIVNYGGIANQEIGHIVRSLHLERIPLQAASAVGATPAQPTPRRVISVDPTLGAETITVDGDLGDTAGGTPAAAGWVVYRSRVSNGGVQGADDALRGFPLVIDDGNNGDPFQNVYVLDDSQAQYAPYFKSQVFGDAANPITLTEAQLIEMITAAEINAPGDVDDDIRVVRNFFTMHTLVYNAFAATLLNLRQLTAPTLWGMDGIKPVAGFKRNALTLSGYPCFHSQLHQRNTVYFADSEGLCVVHNGPAEGQFVTRGGRREVPVPCTTKTEFLYMIYAQLAARERSRMCRRDGVLSPDFM